MKEIHFQNVVFSQNSFIKLLLPGQNIEVRKYLMLLMPFKTSENMLFLE